MAAPWVTNEDRWVQIPEELLYDVTISAEAVRVYGVLRRHGDDPENCYPSYTRIAGFIGKSARSIPAWVRSLEEAGWVERVARLTVSGDPDSNGYRVYGSRRAAERGVRAGQQGGVRAGERGGYALDSAPKESHKNESKGNEIQAPDGATPTWKPTKEQRDLCWDALCEAFAWKPVTAQDRKRMGKVVTTITQAVHDEFGLTEVDKVDRAVAIRAGRYRERHPDWEYTLEAVEKHWSSLGKTCPPTRATGQVISSPRILTPKPSLPDGEEMLPDGRIQLADGTIVDRSPMPVGPGR